MWAIKISEFTTHKRLCLGAYLIYVSLCLLTDKELPLVLSPSFENGLISYTDSIEKRLKHNKTKSNNSLEPCYVALL